MQVDRDREALSAPEVHQGAELGHSPVGNVLRDAELRLRRRASRVDDMIVFSEAESRWLTSLAALEGVPDDIERVAEGILWDAEMEAARAFMWTPAPRLSDLPRKLRVIEREADEVANAYRCGKTLTEWLAIFRADALRLLARQAD